MNDFTSIKDIFYRKELFDSWDRDFAAHTNILLYSMKGFGKTFLAKMYASIAAIDTHYTDLQFDSLDSYSERSTSASIVIIDNIEMLSNASQ